MPPTLTEPILNRDDIAPHFTVQERMAAGRPRRGLGRVRRGDAGEGRDRRVGLAVHALLLARRLQVGVARDIYGNKEVFRGNSDAHSVRHSYLEHPVGSTSFELL